LDVFDQEMYTQSAQCVGHISLLSAYLLVILLMLCVGWFLDRSWVSRQSQYRWWFWVWCWRGNDIVVSSMCSWWWLLSEWQCSCTDQRLLQLMLTSQTITLSATENFFSYVSYQHLYTTVFQ